MKQHLPASFKSNKINFINSLSDDKSFQKVLIQDKEHTIKNRFDLDVLSREDKINIIKNIVSLDELNTILLTYEILYITVDNYIENLEEFATFALKELKRYQNYIGGNNLDDTEWITYTKDTLNCRYNINENIIVLNNSTNTTKLHDSNIMFFLNKLVQHLQKFSTSIIVDYKLTEDEKNDIIWVAIFFEKIELLDIVETTKNIEEV